MKMWQFISEHISDATGQPFICAHSHAVHGGDTTESYVIHDNHIRYFVKIHKETDDSLLKLDAEAEGLRVLAATDTIQVPSIICYGEIEENGRRIEYLVLQHLKLVEGSEEQWLDLGMRLAGLHACAGAPQFGWDHDNYIGGTLQTNGYTTSWAQFFAEHRIGAMLENLAHVGQRLCNIDVAVTHTFQYLQKADVRPSLLHGDLWSGNAGFTKKGPCIYDPAVYYGCRETDIAMTELFGGFPPAFYNGYNDVWPLPQEYQQRKQLYQLYHILNHALLFGGNYLTEAKQQLSRLF